MIKGFNYSNLLKIGLKKNFDVTLKGGADFNFINILIRDLGQKPEKSDGGQGDLSKERHKALDKVVVCTL